MRIGEFAKTNNISIDTVRHYMDLGLLLPAKNSGQYSFDDSCQSTITEVFLLKEMGFKLSEIKTILMFNLLGNMTSYQKNDYYQMLFENKYMSVLEQIKQLESVKDKLSQQLKDFSAHHNKKIFTIGIGLSTIEKLSCIKCQSSLSIKNGEIVENQVINGTLTCTCGVNYTIEDGILMISDGIIDDTTNYNQHYIANYVNSTDISYLESIYQGIDKIQRIIPFDTLHGKTLLELGSGVGFTLRNIYHLLPDDCLYIAVDHDITRHKFLKSILEKSNTKKNILFVCTDFNQLPIQHKSIDFLIDYSGTSNYSFDHTEFLLHQIDRYTKANCQLAGTYILFKKFGFNSLIEDKYRSNFILDNIKDNLNKLDYKLIDDATSMPLQKGGQYEDYFVEGEEIYFYQFYGQRSG